MKTKREYNNNAIESSTYNLIFIANISNTKQQMIASFLFFDKRAIRSLDGQYRFISFLMIIEQIIINCLQIFSHAFDHLLVLQKIVSPLNFLFFIIHVRHLTANGVSIVQNILQQTR